MTVNPRFNATAAYRHDTPAYGYEFGYWNGYCIYAIIVKRSGAAIDIAERQALLSKSSRTEWKVIEGVESEPGRRLSFQSNPPKEEVKFPSPLFAAHQVQRRQLVVFHPYWQVDLDAVANAPI